LNVKPSSFTSGGKFRERHHKPLGHLSQLQIITQASHKRKEKYTAAAIARIHLVNRSGSLETLLTGSPHYPFLFSGVIIVARLG
jgi:hypothetical protein